MTPTRDEIGELQNLERAADCLIAELAASPLLVSLDSMRKLESIAARAAKIAYGKGSPEIVSDQMRHLIAWTDHLDDEPWCARFQQALKARPLVSPYGKTV